MAQTTATCPVELAPPLVTIESIWYHRSFCETLHWETLVLVPAHSKLVIAIAVLALILLGEAPAHAYIDPGQGSLIYQTILAVALGFGFALRAGAARLHRVVKRLRGRDAPSPVGDERT